MGRPGSGEEYLELIARIRRMMPDAAVRSTVMVGYPGESDRDFDELARFIARGLLRLAWRIRVLNRRKDRRGLLDGAVPLIEAPFALYIRFVRASTDDRG